MTHCLNPTCQTPKNPATHRFCQSCGWRLRFGDRYEALYPIGTGHHSRTFLGRDRTTLVHPQCLIKRFTPTGATPLAREAAAERFRQDVVHLAMASRHPQIPDLLGYFERKQQQFLVQQFVVGPTLEQRLQDKGGPFSSEEVLALLQDVLPILNHLHRHQIIHRDLKPLNLCHPPGQEHWWLVDLGAAKPLTATSAVHPGTVVGSAEYTAPEQLRGDATFASDIYSLGVVCLHLLTGLRPFELFDGGQGCWRWRSIVPEVDDRLAAAVDGMVQPVVRDRIPSMAALMTRLGASMPAVPAPKPSSKPSQTPWPALWEGTLETEILAMAPLPGADLLLELTPAGTIGLRSLQTPPTLLHTLAPHTHAPSTLTPHPNEPTFALGTRSGSIEIWSLNQGTWQCRPLSALPTCISQLVFTPNGNTLISGDDQGHIHLWDWVNGTLKATWQDHAKAVTSLAISHNGTTLASGDALGQVKLWHLPTGECLRTLSRHAGAITALCWLAEDQALITAGWDMTLRWCCPATAGILRAVKAQGFFLPVRSLLAHPTHPYVITGSQDGHLQCWDFPATEDIYADQIPAIALAAQTSSAIMGLWLQSPDARATPSLFSVTQTGSLTQRSLPV
ncbi:MAG: protein kinase [Leptolyngbya sp. SIO1E4]|nr:protein kinase [Leptolyngbya sp. SIO1E4]